MFTLKQIESAHAKVKSGADFPMYIHELIGLGVVKYDIFVSDGHAIYYAEDGSTLTSEGVYKELKIADEDNRARFNDCLKLHQEGLSDYMKFCQQAAETGVEKWNVDMLSMTCTYCNKKCEEMLIEKVPAILN